LKEVGIFIHSVEENCQQNQISVQVSNKNAGRQNR